MGTARLRRGKETSVLRGHPWIFSGAIEKLDSIAENGETVTVVSHDGKYLGQGAVSLQSQIRLRMWSFDDRRIDDDFFREKVREALRRRSAFKIQEKSNACRIIFSESDGLPGIIADKYDSFVVVQFLSAGAEFHREVIVRILFEEIEPEGIYERSDPMVRKKEGLALRSGNLLGNEPPELIAISENGADFYVDVRNGHKTGFYLDQRENREWVMRHTPGLEVLNCFSYTGGFGIAALKGGAAKLINVEASGECNRLGEKNAELNGFQGENCIFAEDDVFRLLRKYRDAGRVFDMIIMDPPKFAESGSQVAGAIRGYKDINLLAMKLLSKGGLLVTFSCSGHITPVMFSDMIKFAARDSGREIQLIRKLQQAADHPVMTAFPESEYLKGLVCRVW